MNVMRKMNEEFIKRYKAICFIFPVLVFLYMFLPYILFGQNCTITIHDNLDPNIFASYYLKFKNIPLVDLLFTSINFYFYRVFPPFVAYGINLVFFSLLAFFSMYYFQRLIFGFSFKLIIVLTSVMYACLPCHQVFKMDVAAIPLFFLLFFHIFKKSKNYFWVLPFFYPAVSSFAGTGLFMCGFWMLGVVIVCAKQKRIHWQLLLSLIFLCFGTVFYNRGLFYERFFSHVVLAKDIDNLTAGNLTAGNLTAGNFVAGNLFLHPSDFFISFKKYFLNGLYHAQSHQKFIILPLFLLVSCFVFFLTLSKNGFSFIKNYLAVYRELKISCLCFVLIVSFYLIAALNDIGIIHRICAFLCPSLKGYSFARLFIFCCPLWYILFSGVLIYCCKVTALRIVSVFCIFIQFALICFSGEYYADTLKSWIKNTVTAERLGITYQKPDITYREYYSEDLFSEIKKKINYSGENVCAFGYHPGVLMYNGFKCIDGYNSLCSYDAMVLWHNLMAPEFEHNIKDREYFDSWGGRQYIYSDSLDYNPTREKEHEPVNFDVDMDILRNNFKCKYILSRAEIANVEERKLELKEIFDSDESIYKIFVYEVE